MKKSLAAVAAAGVFAIASVSTPDQANAQWRRGGGGAAVAAGVLGGLAAGAIIAGSRPHYYEPAPVYVAPPPPRGCVDRQWVWSERRGDYVLRHVRVPC